MRPTDPFTPTPSDTLPVDPDPRPDRVDPADDPIEPDPDPITPVEPTEPEEPLEPEPVEPLEPEDPLALDDPSAVADPGDPAGQVGSIDPEYLGAPDGADLDDPLAQDRLTEPAPGGPNDPGASASDQNQADTPGYSGGDDADPTAGDRTPVSEWDEALQEE